MPVDIIVRAWRDPVYRQSVQASALGPLPAHPAGEAMVASWSFDSSGPNFTSKLTCTTTTRSAAACCC